MQIHELQLHTLREAELSEAGLLDLGREVIKNPKALISSQALGAAQQAATQRYAAKLAPGVTNAATAAAPQIARTLAAGWPQIAKTLPAPNVTPNAAVTLPPNYQVPAYLRKQQAQATAQPTAKPTPSATQPTITPSTKIQGAKPGQATAAELDRLEKILQAKLDEPETSVMNPETFWRKPDLKEDAASDYRDQFIKFAQQRLGNVGLRGANLDLIRKDTTANAALAKILDNIVALHANPAQQQAAVENYFTTAINAWNRIKSDPALYRQLSPDEDNAVGKGRQTTVQAGDADQELKQTLAQIGITTAQLEKLAQVATTAAQGSPAFRSTGNPVIDAVLQAAGMRPTR